ncbi:copper resistance CopC family protein [Kineococcus gynurae]|uniref:copper resistance CopC family protein n=1 Tax=Kineococcus gynurae TaxID=452979 RepID=UPI003D7F14AE
MRSDRPAGTRLAGVGLLVLLTGAGVLGPATSASAHTRPTFADPAEGAVLQQLPAVVDVVFDDPLAPAPVQLSVLDATGAEHAADATTSGTGLSAELSPGPAGEYRLEYRVAGADGHAVHGGWTFRVEAAPVVAAPAPAPTSPAAVSSPAAPATASAAPATAAPATAAPATASAAPATASVAPVATAPVAAVGEDARSWPVGVVGALIALAAGLVVLMVRVVGRARSRRDQGGAPVDPAPLETARGSDDRVADPVSGR